MEIPMDPRERFELASRLLDGGKFFKLVCGAGNEDPGEVRRLVLTYTLAGTAAVDVSASPAIVRAAREAMEEAVVRGRAIGREVPFPPFITVSVGLPGDPHVRKARIDAASCTSCGLCTEACDQEAIPEPPAVITGRCIGCGRCGEVCPAGAVSYEHRPTDLGEVIPACLEAGAEMVELHAVTTDDEGVLADWHLLDRLVAGRFLSLCVDRSLLSGQALVARIRAVHAISGDRVIVQADGAPMSGGEDDYRTTLQAVATADIVAKSGIPVRILASGGTNSRTRQLADLCGVRLSGISIGTFARRIIRRQIGDPGFDHDDEILREAVRIAGELVRASTE